eukprot:scaffold157059_cov56-Cyclotella_meneghiniana.AAC.3
MSAMPAIFVLRVMAVLLELGGGASVFDEWNNERRAAAEVAFRMVRNGGRCMFRCYQTIAAN